MKKTFVLLALFSNFLGFNSQTRDFQLEATTINHIDESVNKLKTINKRYSISKVKNEYNNNNPCSSKPYFDQTYFEGRTETEKFQNYNFSMKDYFENMFYFSSYNSMGSCGYVSLIQTMSYYDTFYNDDIIPNIYEFNESTAKNKNDLKYKSLGVMRLPYNDSVYLSYYDFCNKTQNYDLQAKLTILNNINENTYNIKKFYASTNGWNYNKILNSFYGSNIILTNDYSFKTQNEYIETIKSIIDSGNPAILHIMKNRIGGEDRHAVVAYDYDENGIYANFGHGQSSTKKLIYSDGYDCIYGIFTLDFSSFDHKHSNNYVIDGFSYCGCNMPGEVSFKVAPNWINVPPRLYWMKQPGQNNFYTVEFKSWKNGKSIITRNTMGNAFTLSFNQWKRIIDACDDKIYISVTVTNNGNILAITETEIDKPTQYLDYITIAPDQYGFYDGYPTNALSLNNYTYIPTLDNGYAFRTLRFRAGYIHKEYVILSCIRDNYSYASLEYAFSTPVTKIEVDLSFWRDKAYELFTKDSDKAELQIWKDYENPTNENYGEWVKKFDLLSEKTNLPEDRNNQTTYTIEFDTPVYGFRFCLSVEARENVTTNKGRICIGDMKIYFGR